MLATLSLCDAAGQVVGKRRLSNVESIELTVRARPIAVFGMPVSLIVAPTPAGSPDGRMSTSPTLPIFPSAGMAGMFTPGMPELIATLLES